jgi:hypothetical protein
MAIEKGQEFAERAVGKTRFIEGGAVEVARPA